MNKAELIAALAESTNMTKKDSEVFLKSFLDTVVGTLEKGEKVQLVGFGTFEVRERKERVGRNPRTKEEIKIPASKVPVFKPGKDFKEKVNVVPK
ncbi:MAG TPA: DNA-binding protein, partial [Clostridiaceae bacterium]|nr:DNA-binding protein [Clostridiaceae bacterium]